MNLGGSMCSGECTLLIGLFSLEVHQWAAIIVVAVVVLGLIFRGRRA